MPVALLNELVLMAVGIVFGWKANNNKHKLDKFMEDNNIHSYRDAIKFLKALIKRS